MKAVPIIDKVHFALLKVPHGFKRRRENTIFWGMLVSGIDTKHVGEPLAFRLRRSAGLESWCLRLRSYLWYGSEDFIDTWAKFL